MNICHEMGRPDGCQEWIEELYNPYIGSLAETLPDGDLFGRRGGSRGRGSGRGLELTSGGESCNCGCKSFSGDTKVIMADGSTKRLDEIEPGDEVMASDPEAGERGPRVVTHVWVHADDLIRLDLVGASIVTTEDHPFWNHTDREWQRADELDAGDLLKTANGGTRPVIGLRLVTGHTGLAYNLTVSGIHTYYVLAGASPVLVHNSNCGIGRGLIGDERSDHILENHRYPGAAGKDHFPKGWSDDRILNAVADVVTSPNSQRTWYKGSAVHAERTLKTRKGEPAVQNVVGTVGGVRILVRYEPLTGRVLTAFPH
ncbi:polymorphic toxin-type HINT domain-containing protein [Micromonospora sp. NPDC049060]|uniref:polymorphic toxin-type HINT domain-containing protein n=1 Tax=Micromonospora sp. NPDC049060 TaxID=3154828 RepID=UPI0033E68781